MGLLTPAGRAGLPNLPAGALPLADGFPPPTGLKGLAGGFAITMPSTL